MAEAYATGWRQARRRKGKSIGKEGRSRSPTKRGLCADCHVPGHWHGDPECEFVRDGRTPLFVPKGGGKAASSSGARRPAGRGSSTDANLVSAVEAAEGTYYWRFGAESPPRQAGTHAVLVVESKRRATEETANYPSQEAFLGPNCRSYGGGCRTSRAASCSSDTRHTPAARSIDQTDGARGDTDAGGR